MTGSWKTAVRRSACLCLCLLLLAACATVQKSAPSRVDIAPGVVLLLPDAPPFDARATAVQLVEVRYADRSATLQAFVESDATHTTVVMTIPSGPRILSVDWTPGHFTTRLEPQAPAGLTGEHMLADMMLIYAPLPLVAAALDGAQVIEDADGHRRIVKDGATLITVMRPPEGAGGNLWNGPAELENLAYGYRLSIDSQSAVP